MFTTKQIKAMALPKIPTRIKSKTQRALIYKSSIEDETLIIDVFKKDGEEVELTFRYYIKGEESVLLDVKEFKVKKARLQNVLSRTSFYNYDTVWQSERDLKIAKGYMAKLTGKKEEDIFSPLVCYENFLANNKAQAKKDALNNLMAKACPIPKDFNTFVEKAAATTPNYIFYNRKDKISICSKCGSDNLFEKVDFSDKEESICPVCKAKGTFKPLSRTSSTHNTSMVLFIQGIEKGEFFLRYFNVYSEYPNGIRTEVNVKEVIRTHVDFNKKKVTDYNYWYEDYYNPSQMGWIKAVPSMWSADGLRYKFQTGVLYSNKLKYQFKKAGLDKKLSNYKDVVKKTSNDNVYQKYSRYIEQLVSMPALEQLTKSNFNQIVNSLLYSSYLRNYKIIDLNSTSLRDILKVSKGTLRQISSLDPSLKEVSFFQTAVREKLTDAYSAKELLHFYSYFEDDTPAALKAFSWQKCEKVAKYIQDNHIDVHDYFDYHRFGTQLGYNFSSDFVCYPKDFKKAHDTASSLYRVEMDKRRDENLVKLFKKHHEIWDYKGEEYLITSPNKPHDVVKEGQSLHHCVGGYLSKISEERCIILFIRSVKNPKKSLATMEINPASMSVVQVRAANNSTPEKSVLEFVEKFKKEKHLLVA